MKDLRRQRMRELLAGPRFRGDRQKFCIEADVTNARLTQLLDDSEPFGELAANNLISKLGLSANFFTNGVGAERMQIDEFSLTPIRAWEFSDQLPAGEYALIPSLEVKPHQDGQPAEAKISKDKPQAFRTDWIRDKRLSPDKLATMRVDGDSMTPFLFNGDTVVVDTSDRAAKDGKVYALWYGGSARVRRLWSLPGGGLRIKSDNPEHPSIDVTSEHMDSVRIFGRVVHKQGDGGL